MEIRESLPTEFFVRVTNELYIGTSKACARSGQGGTLETKSGRQQEEPGDGLVILLPILAMGTLIGILALLMRSTGKW